MQESPSDDALRVSSLARWIRDRLRGGGVRAETRPCADRGDALSWRGIGAGSGGSSILGHLDTVWSAGTLTDFPFRVDGDRATGPGVFDMKAGIAVAMAVLAELAARGDGEASLLLVPDEEVGSAASKALTLELAQAPHERPRSRALPRRRRQDRAKGERDVPDALSRPRGARGARAGAGRVGARRARPLRALPGDARGPGRRDDRRRDRGAERHADQRDPRGRDASRRRARLVGGRGGPRRARHPRLPARPTRASRCPSREASTARPSSRRRPLSRSTSGRGGCPSEMGFALESVRVGGASDGNFTAAAGVPTLDGLGPRGGGAHARGEFV